jgi:acetylornithine deacetylase
VAGECVVEWEMRPASRSDAARVLQSLREYEAILAEQMAPQCAILTVAEGEVDGLESDSDSGAVRLVQELLGTKEVSTVPFGTEAGLYQQAGIAAVVCGPGSIGVAHQPDEFVALDQLEACLEMMEGLGERLSRS